MGKSKKDKGASNGQDSTFYFAGKKKPETEEDEEEEDEEDELQVSFISVYFFKKIWEIMANKLWLAAIWRA